MVPLFGIKKPLGLPMGRYAKGNASSGLAEGDRGVWESSRSGSLRDVSSVFARNRRPEGAAEG
jgi:hypothetical protein